MAERERDDFPSISTASVGDIPNVSDVVLAATRQTRNVPSNRHTRRVPYGESGRIKIERERERERRREDGRTVPREMKASENELIPYRCVPFCSLAHNAAVIRRRSGTTHGKRIALRIVRRRNV